MFSNDVRRQRRVVTRLRFGIVLITFLAATASAQQPQRPAPGDYRYEDLSTFKNKSTYIVDPYVWAYTSDFAELYRMPATWIDKNLKGALALAFRMTSVGNLTCGYGGKEDQCWPALVCQLDVYYDNSVRLPWVRDDIVRDFNVPGLSSTSHLVPTNPALAQRYASGDPPRPQGFMQMASVDWEIPPTVRGAIWNISYYDKEYQPHIGLIGFRGFCPTVPNRAFVRFYQAGRFDKNKQASADLPKALLMHTIEIPETFMRKAHEAYSRDNKANQERASSFLKDFARDRMRDPATRR